MYQVRIMLPNAKCNLQCKYCINTNNIKGIDNDIDFKALFKKMDLVTFDSISIWGGEPLYNPNLELVLRNIRERYQDKDIYILSNGVLLNEYFVSLFNELNIKYGISHDGKKQYLRCKDFLKNPKYIELLKKLKYFTGFNCVISRDNCDLIEAYNYLINVAKDIKGDWQITFGLFELTSEKILDYMPSVEEYKVLKNSYRGIMQLAINGESHLQSYAVRKKHRNKVPNVWRCGAEGRLTIDCSGNIYLCQVLADQNNKNIPKFSLPAMCINCRHSDYCRGICPIIPDRFRKKLCLCHHLYYDVLEELAVMPYK